MVLVLGILNGCGAGVGEREGVESLLGGDRREALRMFRVGVARGCCVTRGGFGPGLPDVALGAEYKEDGDTDYVSRRCQYVR